MSNASERLEGLLGFNPSKKEPIGLMINEVLDEIRKEHQLEAKTKVKKAILEAIELVKIQADNRKKFEQENSKIEKQIAKILSRLQGDSSSEEPSENTEK